MKGKEKLWKSTYCLPYHLLLPASSSQYQHPTSTYRILGYSIHCKIRLFYSSNLSWGQTRKSPVLPLDTTLFQVCWDFTNREGCRSFLLPTIRFLQTLSPRPSWTCIKSLQVVKTAWICRQTRGISPANNCKVHCTSPLSAFPSGPNNGYIPPYSHPWSNLVQKNASPCIWYQGS